MANRRFTQFYSTLHNKPVQLDCNFIVDPANGNGLGIRSLKGAGIAQVYMHSSATPTGPVNPVAGYIYVLFEDNYNFYYFGSGGFVSPVTGSAISISGSSVLTVGTPYIITSMGTSTQANWHAVGVPAGTTAAVGVSFFATVTGSGTGTGQVHAAGASGIDNIEVIGDPNQTIVSSTAAIAGTSNGSYMILQCLQDGVLTTPATGSVCGLSFVFSNSRLTVQGD